jgi:hypothetical protein
MYIFLADVVGCGEEPNATKFDEKRIYFYFYIYKWRIYMYASFRAENQKETNQLSWQRETDPWKNETFVIIIVALSLQTMKSNCLHKSMIFRMQKNK